MEDQIGISVGIKQGDSINWYRAHSMTRRKDGSMCVFALDDQRTPVVVKAANFSGVRGGIRGYHEDIYPDIREYKS